LHLLNIEQQRKECMMSKSTTTKPATKSASITLRKGTEVLSLLATLRPDNRVEVTVTTKDKETKTSSRGMTEMFPTMAAARAHLTSLAEKAQKLGWQRGKFEVVRKPDAFSTLPAPKAATA
jgi:hypothetical protein